MKERNGVQPSLLLKITQSCSFVSLDQSAAAAAAAGFGKRERQNIDPGKH